MYMKKSIKDIKNLILYHTPKKEYEFSLSQDTSNIKASENFVPKIISTSIDTNLSNLKLRYSAEINSDIILRQFKINIKGKTFKAIIVCIDGMIDSDLVNNFLLRPLMQTNSKPHKDLNLNGIKIQKNFKFDLKTYIHDALVPQNDINDAKNLDELILGVNNGNCALLVDTMDTGILVDVKGYKAREISNPSNEVVVRGSQEAFVEKLRTNTTMLRRLINNENLIIEETTVGKVSKTNIAICYLKNIANSELINEVKFRIKNLDIDYIISSRST